MTGRLPAHPVCPFVWSSLSLQESQTPRSSVKHSTRQAPSDSLPLLVLSLNEDLFSVPQTILTHPTRNRGPPSLLCPHLPGSGALPTYPSSANPTHRPSSEDRCALCLPHHPVGLGGPQRDPVPRVGCGCPSQELAESSLSSRLASGIATSHATCITNPGARIWAPGVQLHKKGRKPTGVHVSKRKPTDLLFPPGTPPPTSLPGSQRPEFPLN